MAELAHITLSHEELEVLRLCDLLGKTQEEAGRSMRVSRGTVQRTLAAARRKTAQALVERCALIMQPTEEEAS